MKSVTNKDNNFSLYNFDNFKKELDTTVGEITQIYCNLIIEYFKFIIEHISFKNINYTEFIIKLPYQENETNIN